MNVSLTPEVRDQLYKLSLTSVQDRLTYESLRLTYMKSMEGVRVKAYLDGMGHKTVGVGFNLDSPQAPLEWAKAFERGGPDFKAVCRGDVELLQEEIEVLLRYSLNSREKELRRMYGKTVWDKLRYNERLAIESLYYNQPSLVRARRRIEECFFFLIVRYATQGCQLSLQKAIEVVKRSAATVWGSSLYSGVVKRRLREAFLLASPQVQGLEAAEPVLS